MINQLVRTFIGQQYIRIYVKLVFFIFIVELYLALKNYFFKDFWNHVSFIQFCKVCFQLWDIAEYDLTRIALLHLCHSSSIY